VRRHRNRARNDLQLVDRRCHGCARADGAPAAGEGELEVAVAAALADALAAAVHGDTARDDEVDRRQFVQRDRRSEGRGAADRGRLRESAAQPGGIEADEASLGGEPWYRDENFLALLKRAKANRPLRGVGVALDPVRPLPLRRLGQTVRRALGAGEIWDAVLEGERKPSGMALAKHAPDARAQRLLGDACLLRRTGRRQAGAPRERASR
jgi:hypothetical protein